MENDPAAQLAAISEARSTLADRLVTPWWYHPVLGLAAAGFVVGYGFGNTVVRLASALAFILVCLGLAHVYKRRAGVWVSGLDAGRAGRWAKATGALVGITAITAWAIGSYTGLDWLIWCIAAFAFVAAVVVGRRFDAALRAQLRAGA
ncbi:hypothetical protein J2S43_002077 [Catenuloplanes nepalensis]|uniref:Uncharacterized protein n=1 Tax=Catenuloplanes nepalensis TaxID=587533 RepID=A0ABT9MQ63_9ACTN|nr:hypothetical protein [Catenuloplanes nepalensis]MDP9793565.1 hypothetical protein [Catenuloplanes nepalensis]